MKQCDVFEMIAEERRYQDEKWGSPTERPHEVGAWILLMMRHLSEASKEWADTPNDDEALRCIRKVAGIATACLEQHATGEHFRGHEAAIRALPNDVKEPT